MMIFMSQPHLRTVVVVPGVPALGQQEPVVDPHVEHDQGQEGDDAEEDGAGNVHVELDVTGVVPKSKSFGNFVLHIRKDYHVFLLP